MIGWDILAYVGAIAGIVAPLFVLYLYLKEVTKRFRGMGKEAKKE
jgi:hypothetical protein